jgi:hypothetical protein
MNGFSEQDRKMIIEHSDWIADQLINNDSCSNDELIRDFVVEAQISLEAALIIVNMLRTPALSGEFTNTSDVMERINDLNV